VAAVVVNPDELIITLSHCQVEVSEKVRQGWTIIGSHCAKCDAVATGPSGDGITGLREPWRHVCHRRGGLAHVPSEECATVERGKGTTS
jgi:hypothetical protein